MATNTILGKWNHVKKEEEEEALLLNKDQHKLRKEDSSSSSTSYLNEEFDFLFFKEQEMCDANDVFFQGQILPLCPSIKHYDHQGIHQLNHSESISSNKSLEFQSNNSSNSRSSSIRSQNSSTSTCSTTSTPITSFSKPRIQNQFHTFSSPKPQLRKFGHRQTSGRKSSLAWEFFRIGVVPMHEIGLRDLKANSSITTTKPFFSNPNKNCSNPSMNGRNHKNRVSNPDMNGKNPNMNHVNNPYMNCRSFNKNCVSNPHMNCRSPNKNRVSNPRINCRSPNKNCASNPNINCRNLSKNCISNPDMNCRSPNKSRVSNPDMDCRNPNKNRISHNSMRKNVKMGNKAYHHYDHDEDEKNNYEVFKQFVNKGSGLFMSGCKCSIETIPLDNVMIKCGTKSGNKTESTQHAKKEKVVDLKKQKNRVKK